jgi:hypothetical protein
LRTAQADKCAFCESKISATGHGDVEHYRPKKAVAQKDGDAFLRPGYYWLAYDWCNLLLACAICNQTFKRNLFPLRHPRRRARSHHDDLTREKPLLIDPSGAINPRRHIGFRAEIAVPLRGSRRGVATIEVAGLNRAPLVEKRLRCLQFLRVLRLAISLLREREANGTITSIEEAKLIELLAHADELTHPDAEYSAMASAFFATRT